ncbi:MAG: hypothetical protein ACI8PD_001735 [Nitrospinales bacterium]|jgi:hypothetical protein
MKNPQLITIPLVSLSYDQERWEPSHEWEEKIFNTKNYIKILAPMELPDFSYGVEIKDSSLFTYFGVNTVAIFSKSDFPAQDNIFLVGLKGKPPLVGKLLKNESDSEGQGRKTFMTPTPLHIPESKTSPIADSLHQTLIFKVLSKPQGTRFFPHSNIGWRHPLIFVQKTKN